MVLWEKLVAGGGGAVLIGILLIYGFDRGWFSSHYTSTIEGGEGVGIFGLFLSLGGIVALCWGAWAAI